MIPYKEEFARINIPVLNPAGYYYGGPGAAVYYFTEHLRYNPKAEHYLLIGPYDHFEAQRGTGNAFGQHTESSFVISGLTMSSKARPTGDPAGQSQLRSHGGEYLETRAVGRGDVLLEAAASSYSDEARGHVSLERKQARTRRVHHADRKSCGPLRRR
jgi:hypothetical protein